MSLRNPSKAEQMTAVLKALNEPHARITEVWHTFDEPPMTLVTKGAERHVRRYVVYALIQAGHVECSNEYLTAGGFDQTEPIEHYEYTITDAGKQALAAAEREVNDD